MSCVSQSLMYSPLLARKTALAAASCSSRTSFAHIPAPYLLPSFCSVSRHRVSCAHSSSATSEDKMLGGIKVDIVDAIIQDHKEIKNYYQQYKSSSSGEDKQKWSNQWRWEVARHSIGEELVAYPAMEKYVPGGISMADKDRSQHQTVKDNLAELEKMTAGSDPSFDSLMDETQRALDQHIKEEEGHDLVELRKNLPDGVGVKLGTQFELTKKFVPTHSHPAAPNKPPFETVAGLLAAPLDKLRDVFQKFPSEEELRQVNEN